MFWFRGVDGGDFDAPQKLTHPDGSEIQEGNASSVAVADWDGDGAKDLLVGSSDGSVHWFRNLAKDGEPHLATAIRLLVPDETSGHHEGDAVRPGARTKVCVADWNGDGRQDLLVGDLYWRTLAAPPTPTPEEQKELAEAEARFQKLNDRQVELRAKVESKIRTEKGWAEDRQLTDVENDWFFDETFERLYEIEEYVKLDAEMEGPLEVMRRFQPQTETHGYVWVCLREGDRAESSKP